MKILQVITSLRVGGAEKLIVDMVPLYLEQGYQVDVLLFDGTETPFRKNLKDQGVKVYDFGYGGSVYNPLHIFRLIPFLKQYDIVHTHNTAPQIFAAVGSLLCSVILMTTEHNTSNRRRGWKWYRAFDRWMYGRYRRVICISDQAEINLKKFHPSLNNICTVYNGVNVQAFRDAIPIPELRQSGRIVVVMVAGFRYQKDQDTLIKAFTHLPKDKFELWLVGDGERRPQLEKLVSENTLNRNVYFLGIRSDVPRVLKTADIIVVSSHWEGLSLSNIEGMSAMKPFIASDVDGLHEVTQGAGILFRHGDDKALAKEILQIVEDEMHCMQVVDRCWERAKQYDITTMVDKYERIYHELYI